MPESPLQAAERIVSQMKRRNDGKVFYVALGNSRRFIAFTRSDVAYSLYSNNPRRMVGTYTRETPAHHIAEDIEFSLSLYGYAL